jgi:NAD(P)-dependent dehydrogenase (short-subunit alcohol dehydrogenase family)
VVVADIDEAGAKETAEGLAAAGGIATSVRVDIADHDSVAAMADTATRQFGGIDLLVNNAAIFGGMKLDFLLTVDWDYLRRFLEVNLLGALVCTRACYRSMAARGGGAIVNQSSTAAYLYAGYYGWAKAGINSLTQQLAHELGGMNIRVNAIAPGPTDTEAARSVVPDDYMRELVGSLALKRQGSPEDLVGMCLFLLSDDARWVTGHVFNVDGGQVMRP